MKRKLIEIDESLCDGCGQCVSACHEGALALVNGKAKLVSESYCDGLGACIGECPRGALRIVEREVGAPAPTGHVCPGSALRTLHSVQRPAPRVDEPPPSALSHWPVQLMLVPPQAPFLAGADLLVCADCVPFAVPDFHSRYLAGRAVVVGCPKLDDLAHYAEKLAAIVQTARPRKLTVLRMEVPCCRGIAQAAIAAAHESGLDFPVEEHIIAIGGGITRNVIRPARDAAAGQCAT